MKIFVNGIHHDHEANGVKSVSQNASKIRRNESVVQSPPLKNAKAQSAVNPTYFKIVRSTRQLKRRWKRIKFPRNEQYQQNRNECQREYGGFNEPNPPAFDRLRQQEGEGAGTEFLPERSNAQKNHRTGAKDMQDHTAFAQEGTRDQNQMSIQRNNRQQHRRNPRRQQQPDFLFDKRVHALIFFKRSEATKISSSDSDSQRSSSG